MQYESWPDPFFHLSRKHVRTLCRLQSLKGTGCCGQLQWLDVSRNQLTQLHGLAAFPLLQTLLASDNRISAFPTQLPTVLLRELWLNGNRHE